MAKPSRTLFLPIVPTEKLDPQFKFLQNSPSYDPARTMMDEVFQDFDDHDGNFLEQFQTTGFNPRFFELYLFAYFSMSGFKIDRSHPSPDFIVSRDGVTVSVEATTLNPSKRESATDGSMPFSLDEDGFKQFLNHELPIREPLNNVIQVAYNSPWELYERQEPPMWFLRCTQGSARGSKSPQLGAWSLPRLFVGRT